MHDQTDTESSNYNGVSSPQKRFKPKSKISREIYAFNGLRAIFILMVMTVHNYTSVSGLLSQGVDGFLLMSGWLNSMSMDATYERLPKLKGIKNFFVHRFFRIAPCFYLCIITIILIGADDMRQ